MHVGEPGYTEAAEVSQGLSYDEVPGRALASFIPTFMQRADFERIMVSRFREVPTQTDYLIVNQLSTYALHYMYKVMERFFYFRALTFSRCILI